MATCINCQQKIDDLRRETRCHVCGAPLHRTCAIKENNKFYCDVCYTVKYKTETDIPKINIPDIIRRSHIETYLTCPYKFYMEVVKGIKAPPNIYTQVGIDIHSLIEKLCLNPTYTQKEMLDEFNALWKNYPENLFENETLKNKMYLRAMNSITNAYKIIPEMPVPLSTEDKIVFSIGDSLPQISTTIDRIDISEERLEVSDWKTGAVMVGQRLSSDLQAPLYIYAAQQKYNKPVKRFTFYYLQNDKQRIFEHITGNDYVCTVRKRKYLINTTDTIRKVKSAFSHILKGNFNIPQNTRKMFFTCKICHIQQMRMCQGAELESWTQNKKRRLI